MTLRNACRRCGRSKEWHEIANLPEKDLENKARDIANTYMVENKLDTSPARDFIFSVITHFVKQHFNEYGG